MRGDYGKPLLSYEEVRAKWGNKLIAVASQIMRERVLLKDSADPSSELSSLSNCINIQAMKCNKCRVKL